jgi:hypothetical protein
MECEAWIIRNRNLAEKLFLSRQPMANGREKKDAYHGFEFVARVTFRSLVQRYISIVTYLIDGAIVGLFTKAILQSFDAVAHRNRRSDFFIVKN